MERSAGLTWSEVYADVDTADALDESYPSFVVSASCKTACPEEPDPVREEWQSNMARALIRKGAAAVVGTMQRTVYQDYQEGWQGPGANWGTPTLYTYVLGSLLTDNGASIGRAHGSAVQEYYLAWHNHDEWMYPTQGEIMCCSSVTGEPALRREGTEGISYTNWTRKGWYIFTLPVNPCEPGQSRLFGGYPIPLRIFDPTDGQWELYSGDLDTDHAYKAWGPLSLSYSGCEATVDQHIDLGTGTAPRTYWIGTAGNHETNTNEWHITDGLMTKTLEQAAAAGWIDANLVYFNNVTGQEVPFTAGDGTIIQPRNGVKIRVLMSGPQFTLVVPRTG